MFVAELDCTSEVDNELPQDVVLFVCAIRRNRKLRAQPSSDHVGQLVGGFYGPHSRKLRTTRDPSGKGGYVASLCRRGKEVDKPCFVSNFSIFEQVRTDKQPA